MYRSHNEMVPTFFLAAAIFSAFSSGSAIMAEQGLSVQRPRNDSREQS